MLQIQKVDDAVLTGTDMATESTEDSELIAGRNLFPDAVTSVTYRSDGSDGRRRRADEWRPSVVFESPFGV